VEGGYKVWTPPPSRLPAKPHAFIVFSIADPGSIGAILSGKGRSSIVAG